MKLSKKISNSSPFLLTIAGFVLLLIFVSYFTFKNKFPTSKIQPTTNIQTVEEDESENITSGLPVRLKIPNIDIDVAIENVGLTPDGSMAVPKSTSTVGWFELGQRPGENGTAVIAGHYGPTNGKPSVFDNLSKLQEGGKIYIEDDRGITISFVIRKSDSYNPTADATQVFSSDDELSHLNLITCEGAWDKEKKNYSSRLVIFTDKE